MTRGYFDDFASNPVYIKSKKNWHITLQQSSCYWYDLIINPPDFTDTKNNISSQLEYLRETVEQALEKRFIYFFASRTKVRFDTNNPPRYSLFNKYLIISLLVGRDKKRIKIKIKLCDSNGCLLTPKVDVSERFIRIYHNDTNPHIYSVHDFLQTYDISLGIATQVHYIGITKAPAERPLSRKHRGITDTLYNISNEENDFFIFINLFKVLSEAKNDESGFNIVIANSMIDEIPTNDEGRIIESALIAYFDCASQRVNRNKERSELINKLASISNEFKIHSVSVHLEIELPNEYFIFGSETSSPAAPSHSFLYRHSNGNIEEERFSSEDELRKRLNKIYNTHLS